MKILTIFSSFFLFSCSSIKQPVQKTINNSLKHKVLCTFEAGGEKISFEILQDSIYKSIAHKINSYFKVRVGLFLDPSNSNLLSLNIYTYAPYDNQDKMISFNNFKYEPISATKNINFGTHFVYEPDTEAELKYWCEIL